MNIWPVCVLFVLGDICDTENNVDSNVKLGIPSLANTGLANVKNAFEPWDTDKELDSARHPLRAFDDDLKPDPWLGDSYRI